MNQMFFLTPLIEVGNLENQMGNPVYVPSSRKHDFLGSFDILCYFWSTLAFIYMEKFVNVDVLYVFNEIVVDFKNRSGHSKLRISNS